MASNALNPGRSFSLASNALGCVRTKEGIAYALGDGFPVVVAVHPGHVVLKYLPLSIRVDLPKSY